MALELDGDDAMYLYIPLSSYHSPGLTYDSTDVWSLGF